MRIAARVGLICVGVLWLALVAAVGFDQTVDHAWKAILGATVLLFSICGVTYVVLASKRALGRPRSTALVVAAAAGFLLSTPVPLEWDDGCNRETGTTYAVTAPYILVARPADTKAAFGGTRTLKACFRPSG